MGWDSKGEEELRVPKSQRKTPPVEGPASAKPLRREQPAGPELAFGEFRTGALQGQLWFSETLWGFKEESGG